MNGFGNFGGNNCLWILILLLILFCSQSGILHNILDSCYLPLALAIAYCICKKGGLCNLFNSGWRLQISADAKNPVPAKNRPRLLAAGGFFMIEFPLLFLCAFRRLLFL